jgi:hypothetical protein
VLIEPPSKKAPARRPRRVATFLLKGSSGGPFYAKETFFHHPPEINGPGFRGGPLVRDRNAALVDPDQWDQPADPDRLERRYYATDWQGRVVSMVTAAGEQAESYRYTANGVPIGIPLGDVNGDGKVELGANDEDWQQAYWWENNFGAYDARLDLNLDGSNNATDIGLVGSQTPGSMPTARASAASVGNRMFASASVDREAVLDRIDFRWIDPLDLARRACIIILEAHLERLRPAAEGCGKPKLLTPHKHRVRTTKWPLQSTGFADIKDTVPGRIVLYRGQMEMDTTIVTTYSDGQIDATINSRLCKTVRGVAGGALGTPDVVTREAHAHECSWAIECEQPRMDSTDCVPKVKFRRPPERGSRTWTIQDTDSCPVKEAPAPAIQTGFTGKMIQGHEVKSSLIELELHANTVSRATWAERLGARVFVNGVSGGAATFSAGVSWGFEPGEGLSLDTDPIAHPGAIWKCEPKR